MADGPETRLVARIVKVIRAAFPSAFVEKIHGGPYQRAGLPDLLVIVDGFAIGLEVKAQGADESDAAARGRLTMRQRVCLTEINEADGVGAVVLSPDEALACIHFVLTGPRPPAEVEMPGRDT